MGNTFLLPEGTLAVVRGDDQAVMSSMKGISLNLVTLLHEILYQLQDGVIVELHAQEGGAIQVVHEQKINMDQLIIKRYELVFEASRLE